MYTIYRGPVILERIVSVNGEYQTVTYVRDKLPRNLILDIPDHRNSRDLPNVTKYYLRASEVTIRWHRPFHYMAPFFAVAFSFKYQIILEKVEGEYPLQNIADKVIFLLNKYKDMSENQIMERCIVSLKNEIEIKNEEATQLKIKIEKLEKIIKDREKETVLPNEPFILKTKKLQK